MINHNTPEFKTVVAKIYNEMKGFIEDEVLETEVAGVSSRYRRALIILSGSFINQTSDCKYPIVDLYREAIEMVMVDLRNGYTPPAVSLEIFDHQAIDWALARVEEFHNKEHMWSKLIDDNPAYIACLSIGFGSIPSESRKECALLPVALQQVLKNIEGTEDTEVIEYDCWDLQKDGVLVNTDVLKSFGR